jgi:transposase
MIKIKETYDLTRKKSISLVMALANKIIRELGFVEIINQYADWDEDHWGISPGNLAKAFVLTTFTEIRSPLTHIAERLSPVDLPFLLGNEADYSSPNAFNVGRALERIGKSNYNQAYETMALTALQIYDIPSGRNHSDTTTVSFYGEYDVEAMNLTEEEKAELLQIEQGYNKDGRPGCNQAVVGQIVNEHGIPLTTRVLDGSTSDAEWNRQALDYLDSMMQNGFQQGIYVADSKTVDDGLIRRMNGESNRISFVSRCPAAFSGKLESRMVRQAYSVGTWESLGQVGKGRQSSEYRCMSFTEEVCGSPMRLLVLESSALSIKAEASLLKERGNLVPLVRRLEKQVFACQADAETAYHDLGKSAPMRLFSSTVEIIRNRQERWPRGRRSATACPDVTETYHVRIQDIMRNEEACRDYLQNESCIVLISNLTDAEAVTNKELLEIYKGQYVVENSFRQLKTPSMASVIYLKNPTRIAGLTMLLSFSLLVRAIIQYRMRDGLKKHEGEKPDEPIYAGWAGRPLKSPTYKLLYEHSINCRFDHTERDEYSLVWPDVETKHYVMSLLTLMGVKLSDLLQ